VEEECNLCLHLGVKREEKREETMIEEWKNNLHKCSNKITEEISLQKAKKNKMKMIVGKQSQSLQLRKEMLYMI